MVYFAFAFLIVVAVLFLWWKRRKVFRKRYPRIYELREFVPSPHPPEAYFKDLDISLAQISQKRKQYDDIESELAGLDEAAWSFLKQEARPYVLKRDKHRAWQQLFDILNQAKAYGYLKREGCQDIAFIPRSTIDGQQTPDLKATDTEGPVLCEVKTLNVSKDEIDRMKTGGVGATQSRLNDAFLNKLTTPLSAAERQMATYFPGEPKAKATAISPSNPLQIKSLTAYASQVKHQWTKYAEDNNGTLRQISYADLASVIRAGNTATVLNLQDWNPYLRVGTTEERYGSHLSLIEYDCGRTPRSMILAQVTFYGHMGSGSQVDGGSDMPKEPADGWYVMPASYNNGRTNFDLKAREMACKPGSAASNTALPSPRPPQGSTIASRSTPPSSDDKMLASDLQNCDRLAQQQSDAAMTLTPVAPVSVLSPILLLNDLNKRKQEEENQPVALANIEGQRLQCRQNAQSVAAQRAQERDNELQDESQGYKRISVETFELDAKTLTANQSKISLKGVYWPCELSNLA
jgi:surface-adhesin protein E